MAILIERQTPWHLGHQRVTNQLTEITTRELHFGWVSVLWFPGSIKSMIDRWRAAQDDAVRAYAERWLAAENAGTPESNATP